MTIISPEKQHSPSRQSSKKQLLQRILVHTKQRELIKPYQRQFNSCRNKQHPRRIGALGNSAQLIGYCAHPVFSSGLEQTSLQEIHQHILHMEPEWVVPRIRSEGRKMYVCNYDVLIRVKENIERIPVSIIVEHFYQDCVLQSLDIVNFLNE